MLIRKDEKKVCFFLVDSPLRGGEGLSTKDFFFFLAVLLTNKSRKGEAKGLRGLSTKIKKKSFFAASLKCY